MRKENGLDINKYVGAVWTAASSWSCGYGQGDGVGGRWDIRDGGASDCSSLTIWGAQMGGYPTGGATYTGNMRAELTSVGWAEVPIGQPSKGDILWKTGHVAVCIDDGANLSEAWINENDDIIGGQPGDQTGDETRTIGYWEHPFTQSGAWEVILRPPAAYPANGWSMELPLTDRAVRPPAQPRRPGGNVTEAHAAPVATQGGSTGGFAWGVDISMHQDYSQVPGDAEIVIIKATEGTGYADPKWRSHAQKAWDQGKKVGLYHFARPDLGNSPEEEAAWFLEVITDWNGWAVLVLDWEPSGGWSGNVDWARRFLDAIWYGSKTRPWIYMNLSTASGHAWAPVSGHYPLWLASYDGRAWNDLSGPHPGHGWRLCAKQYTDSPIDKDTFYFPASTWDALVKTREWPDTATSTTTEEDELSTVTDAVVNTNTLLHHLAQGTFWNTDVFISQMRSWIAKNDAERAADREILKQLAKNQAIDPTAVEEATKAAVKAALDSFEITLATKKENN